jgi:hypothetical protein
MALAHTYRTTIPKRHMTSFTLCHGVGGNAMLFFNDGEKGLQTAQNMAEYACESKKQGNIYQPGLKVAYGTEDLSLFMGNAGIGYFYLRCYAPEEVPDILYPKVSSNTGRATLSHDYSIESIKRTLICSLFPETLKTIQSHEEINFSHSHNGIGLIDEFIENVEEKVGSSHELATNFELEKPKMRLEQSIESYAYLNIARLVDKEENENHLPGLIHTPCAYKASLASFSQLIKSQKSDAPILLYATVREVKTFELNPLSEILIEESKTATSIEDLISQCSIHFDLSTSSEKQQVKSLIHNQLQEMVKRGIMVIKLLSDAKEVSLTGIAK